MNRALFIGLAWFALATSSFGADPKPAVLQVSGYGLLGNRELKKMLVLLQPTPKAPEFYDANYIEDAAVILLSRAAQDGYLKPRITVLATLADGRIIKQTWDATFDTFLPRPLNAKRVRFIIHRGQLYYYQQLEITGLFHLSGGEARKFFEVTDTLLLLKSSRIYTPTRLSRSMANLAETLARQGYVDAKVSVANLSRDDQTGAVQLRVTVTEGRRTIVRSVQVKVFAPGENQPRSTSTRQVNLPYSVFWEQNFAQELRTNEYHQGFPDASVVISPAQREANGEDVNVDLLATIQTGPHIVLGQVIFKGQVLTRESVMRDRVSLKPGTDLDRIQVEKAREDLARLGAFNSIEVHYENVDDHTRDVIYQVKEGKTIDVSLLFGYGSYELFRGGFEVNQYNLFGRGYLSRLRVMQSIKATYVDYLYTMPGLIGHDIDVFLDGNVLRRQELTFYREEYEVSLGAQRLVRAINSEVTVRYNYEYLNASREKGMLPPGVEQALVGAIEVDLKHDERDNPLLPHRGYDVLVTSEFASPELGGDVSYERFQLAIGDHFTLGGGRYLHLGLSEGSVITIGNTADNLPFDKRFFPGGEDSVRGYQQGEAAPRNAQGKIVGAETFLQGNFELEQALTPSWSVVAFIDAVGFAESIHQFPMDQVLYSVGGGVHWNTVVGPVRLEYGYNPIRRPRDPVGTVQFSVGFPF